MKQPWNHCYCETISESTMKNLHEKLILCTKVCFHSWFYILGIFFKFPLSLTVIKLCIFTMRSSVQKFKNHWVLILEDFVFAFIGFMLFSRFCKFAVNISICDINWFVSSFRVLCVLISLSFSVRQRQSTFSSIFSARLTKFAFNIICYLHKIYLQESLFRCS